MESFISSHIDKLNQIAPNDDSQIDLHVKAKFGAKENLIVTQNDLRLSCCMYWKTGSFDISIIKRDFLNCLKEAPQIFHQEILLIWVWMSGFYIGVSFLFE